MVTKPVLAVIGAVIVVVVLFLALGINNPIEPWPYGCSAAPPWSCVSWEVTSGQLDIALLNNAGYSLQHIVFSSPSCSGNFVREQVNDAQRIDVSLPCQFKELSWLERQKGNYQTIIDANISYESNGTVSSSKVRVGYSVLDD